MLENVATTTSDFKKDADITEKINILAKAHTIHRHHRDILRASASALDSAMAAGDELIAVKIAAKFVMAHGDGSTKNVVLVAASEAVINSWRGIESLLKPRGQIGGQIGLAIPILSIADAIRVITTKKKDGNKSPELSSAERLRQYAIEVGMEDWLAAIPPEWWEALAHRVDHQDRLKKLTPLEEKLSKAIHQVLSLQKTATDKNNTRAAVAAELNGMNNLITAADADLNDYIMIRSSVKRAA